MMALLNFATLAIFTIFAAAAAAGFHALLLRMTFALMRPAMARRVSARPELARAYAPQR